MAGKTTTTYTCALCEKPIGKNRVHIPTAEWKALCSGCLGSPEAHGLIDPQCRVEWHDGHDHAQLCTKGAFEAMKTRQQSE